METDREILEWFHERLGHEGECYFYVVPSPTSHRRQHPGDFYTDRPSDEQMEYFKRGGR